MTGKRLLLVDDETALVDLLKRYLERCGLQVQSCTDPHAALEFLDADPDSYALVITDLTLPGMSGEELIAHMRAVRPGLPVIIASGYPYQPRAEGIEFLQKPFLPRKLAELIQRMLGPESTDPENTASAKVRPPG